MQIATNRKAGTVERVVGAIVLAILVAFLVIQGGCSLIHDVSIIVTARSLYDPKGTGDYIIGATSANFSSTTHKMEIGNRTFSTVDLGFCLTSGRNFEFVADQVSLTVTPEQKVCFSSNYAPDNYKVLAINGGP